MSLLLVKSWQATFWGRGIGNSLKLATVKYYFNLKRLESFPVKYINLKIKKGLSVSQMKEKYNLYCLDSFLDNTLFCNTNKFLLLRKIENGKEELSSNAYDYLFNHLFLPKQAKCSILKRIYSKNFDYPNISSIVEKYCDDYLDFKSSYEIIKVDKNIFSTKIPSTYDAKIVKLVNQWYYFLSSKKIPNENVISHVNFIKKLLSDGTITKREAFIELNVINEIKKKVTNNINSENLINLLNVLINWDNIAGIPSLKSLAWNVKLISNNDNIIYKSDNVISVREKLLSIIKQQYNKVFKLSQKVEFDSATNTATLTGYLILSAKDWDNYYKTKKILVSFNIPLNSVIWNKFKIANFRILDKWALNYIRQSELAYPKEGTLFDISNQLNDLLANYVLNNRVVKITFCDKVRNLIKNWSCSGHMIQITDNKIMWLNIKYYFDDNQVLRKVQLPSSVKVETKKWWSINPSYINIKLSNFEKNLNNIISKKDYSVNQINLITVLIQKYVTKSKKAYKAKQIWMKLSELLNIDSLLKKYLWVTLVDVKHLKWSLYDLYFSLNKYKFESVYDLSKNTIYVLALELPQLNKKFTFNVKLKLSDLDAEELNNFKEDPLGYLSDIDPKKVEEYKNLVKKMSK